MAKRGVKLRRLRASERSCNASVKKRTCMYYIHSYQGSDLPQAVCPSIVPHKSKVQKELLHKPNFALTAMYRETRDLCRVAAAIGRLGEVA